ncbi:MAG: hypothetical protein RL497_2439 [Pseudomonadota bacterium]|jgi:hypothetical protein
MAGFGPQGTYQKMELALTLGVLLLIGWWVYHSPKKSSNTQGIIGSLVRNTNNAQAKFKVVRAENIILNFKNPIPKGYQIFVKNLEIAGIAKYHKEEAIAFCRGEGQCLL